MDENVTALPPPSSRGKVSLEEALNLRSSERDFRDEALTLQEISQLLWACAGKKVDGVSGASRTYASAGGIHPLEVYLVAGKVESLQAGIYLYRWKEHALDRVKWGDFRRDLALAAIGQRFVAQAPASLIIAAVYERTGRVYGERGRTRYVRMDAGHASQNVYLQAVSLGLGTVAVGAFIDERVKKVLGLGKEEPLYIMPVGRP